MKSHAKLTGLMVAGIVFLSSLVAPLAAKERSYASTKHIMTLAGKSVGFVDGLEGGTIVADVIEESAGSSLFTKKRIGTLRYEEFAVKVSPGMDGAVYDWIAKSWSMKAERKSGSLVLADMQLQAQSERQFVNALITETTIPALDAGSKEPTHITLRFAPQSIRVVKASGKVEGDVLKNAQRMFVSACFRLQIDGLDCTRISHIDSFTVKQLEGVGSVGAGRTVTREAGKVVFPNLKVTQAESTAQSWLDWHESFVVQGNNDDKAEKNGTLELLSPDLQTTLARVRFFNAGIFSIRPDTAKASFEQPPRVIAELYVERMEFEAGSTGTTLPSTTPSVPLRRG